MSQAERVNGAEKRFNKAVEVFNKLPSSIRPNHEQEIRLYASWMQVTKGDNQTDRPGGLDIRAITKWAAWGRMNGIPKYEAQEDYYHAVRDVLKHADSDEGGRLSAELDSVAELLVFN